MGVASGRLVAFAGLALLAAGHWATLVSDPPLGRLGLVVAIAVGAGAALIALELRAAQWRVRPLLAAGVVVAAALGGLFALGFPPGHLLPSGWEQLGADLDSGFGALSGNLDYPFEGGESWSRLLLLAGLPLLLALALAAAFGPGRGAGPRLDALAILIGAYAIPATVNPNGSDALAGLLLLALVAVWLWAPRLGAKAPIALVALAGLVAAPLAGALEGDPWLDYRSWEISGVTATSFDWGHSYGPIDWPRTGEPLFRVESDQPRYWRADVLDTFDGVGWSRSSTGGAAAAGTLGPPDGLDDPQARWIEQASFSVSSLRSGQVISPGTPRGVRGLGEVLRDADGSARFAEATLDEDSGYEVSAYVPDPSVKKMRARSTSYPPELSAYTQLSVPRDRTNSGLNAVAPVPLWGSPLSRAPTEETFAAGPYAQMANLAERLTAGAPSAYDATRAIENYLRSTYTYSESPPEREIPLAAFLFEDRVGYCQQFSGAMAAMLRMVGVPARVAAGFTPGSRVEPDGNVYEVTDLDAHSWVEVYFDRIGWVPFDPTPSNAPARAQSGGPDTVSAALGAGATNPELDLDFASPGTVDLDSGSNGGGGGNGAGGAGDGAGSGLPATLIALLAVGFAAPFGMAGLRAARHRRLEPTEAADREIAELERLAGLAGVEALPSTTLGQLGDRLKRKRHRRGAAYVAELGSYLYGPSGRPPSLAARRGVRSEVGAGAGLWTRLRAWWAMPPGGPRKS